MPIAQQKKSAQKTGADFPEPPKLFRDEDAQRRFEEWYFQFRQTLEREFDRKVDKSSS